MDYQTFPFFSRFPTEIRIKIWNAYTMLEPRIVEVCLTFDDEASSYGQRNTKRPFYSPTPLPKSLFNINRESRAVALNNYPLGFPNAHHNAQIRWNPSTDTIFLPAWCFQYECNDFMEATSEEEKGLIQKLAFETLIWQGCCDDGDINRYIQVGEFRNLKELVLVLRLPDYTGCGCCHDFDGPEKGVAGFRELDHNSDEVTWDVKFDEDEVNEEEFEQDEVAQDEVEEAEVAQNEAEEDEDEDEVEEVDGEVRQDRRNLTIIEQCMNSFMVLHERDPDWSIPSVRRVQLTRDGIII